MARPFWSPRVEPIDPFPARDPAGVVAWLARWTAVGTAASVGFGVGLGLLLGLSGGDSMSIAIGGGVVGLLGGPFFGVAVGLIHTARMRWHGKGRRGIGAYALTGALIFPIVPIAVVFVRHGEIVGQSDLGEFLGGLLFFVVTGGTLGAISGVLIGDGRRGKPTIGPLD